MLAIKIINSKIAFAILNVSYEVFKVANNEQKAMIARDQNELEKERYFEVIGNKRCSFSKIASFIGL